MKKNNLSKREEKNLIQKIHEVCALRLQYLRDKGEIMFAEIAEECHIHPARISEIANFKQFSIKYLPLLIKGGYVSTAMLLNNIANLSDLEKEYIYKFSIYEDTELLSLLEEVGNNKNKDLIIRKLKKLLMKEIEIGLADDF